MGLWKGLLLGVVGYFKAGGRRGGDGHRRCWAAASGCSAGVFARVAQVLLIGEELPSRHLLDMEHHLICLASL